MPFRLIGIIILLILVTIFAGVNLDNKCDINFIFYVFNDIPIFMTAIISFAAGAVVMLPFTIFRGKKKTPEKQLPPPQKTPQTQIEDNSKTLFDFKIKKENDKTDNKDNKSEKKRFFRFGKHKKSDDDKTDEKAEENVGAPV